MVSRSTFPFLPYDLQMTQKQLERVVRRLSEENTELTRMVTAVQ